MSKVNIAIFGIADEQVVVKQAKTQTRPYSGYTLQVLLMKRLFASMWRRKPVFFKAFSNILTEIIEIILFIQ